MRSRAAGRCEYCRLSQHAELVFVLHIDHVIPRQHEGADIAANLAIACHHCNRHKGTNLSGIDPDSGAVVMLFNPRTQRWDEHFDLRHGIVVGKTPVGRATVKLLQMNVSSRVIYRQWDPG